MSIEVGHFQNEGHRQLCEALEDVILSFASERQLSLLEAVGALEVVKLAMYRNQIEIAYEGED